MMGADVLKGLKNDPSALAKALVDEYGARLLKTAYRLCGNRATAEDLTARTMAKAVTDISKLHDV